MVDVSILSRLVDGVQRNVDISQNSLVVGSLKVGTSTPTELTKTILDNLVSLQNGSDVAASLHHHDSLYYRKTALNSTTSGSSGAKQIGVSGTPVNHSPASADVQAYLNSIDSALSSAGNEKSDSVFRIVDNGDATKKIAFEAAGIATATTRTITMPDANVDLGNLTNSNISASAAIAESKLALDYSTSSLNTAISGKISSTLIGANNGVAPLDAGGKIPVAYLPNSVMTFEGVWDASTNTPTLADNANGANAGMVYLVSVAGTQNLGSGSQTFAAGDWVVANSSNVWQKSVNSNAVVSVNGQTGVVTINAINQLTGDVTTSAASGSQSLVSTISNSAVTLAKLASNSVDENKIVSTALSSSGALTGGSGSKLAWNPDGTTLEINANAARIKDLGVSTAKLAATSVTAAKLGSDVAGAGLAGGNGSALSVAYAPAIKADSEVAGEAFAATTLFAVRYGQNAETAGSIYKADKDASTTDNFYAIGLFKSVGALAAADPMPAITKAGLMSAPSHGLTVGKPFFLAASGAVTSTAPSAINEAVIKLGMVKDANTLDIQIQIMGVN